MKLLSKIDAHAKVKRDNDELIASNIRLRHLWQDITNKLNTIKENYDPQKIKLLHEFENFCKDITEKKSKLLEELMGIQKEIEIKKDLYFGLIAKQDALDEKIFQMKEQEKKLDMREAFVVDLENKWREKNNQ